MFQDPHRCNRVEESVCERKGHRILAVALDEGGRIRRQEACKLAGFKGIASRPITLPGQEEGEMPVADSPVEDVSSRWQKSANERMGEAILMGADEAMKLVEGSLRALLRDLRKNAKCARA